MTETTKHFWPQSPVTFLRDANLMKRIAKTDVRNGRRKNDILGNNNGPVLPKVGDLITYVSLYLSFRSTPGSKEQHHFPATGDHLNG